LTPNVYANEIQRFRINLGSVETGLVIGGSATGPAGWSFGTGSYYVYWQADVEGVGLLDGSTGDVFTYGFDHPNGPVESHSASAQDDYGFTGPVNGPQPPPIPEPMTALLGVMGLGSVAGFRRLRKS